MVLSILATIVVLAAPRNAQAQPLINNCSTTANGFCIEGDNDVVGSDDTSTVEEDFGGRVVPAKGGEQASGRLKGWFKTEGFRPTPVTR
jgi:hypothetical protein